MLHEILLALVGHVGSVVVAVYEVPSGDAGRKPVPVRFEVAADFDYVAGPERVVVNELCRLGFWYSRLEAFVRRHQHVSLAALARAAAAGVYVRALAGGVDEVLDGYRAAILSAEQQILADPDFPLARLVFLMRDYAQLLPPLCALVDEVSGSTGFRSLHGGEIAQLLYKRSIAGAPALQACMQRLLFHCNRVLFNQVTSWVVHGQLTDPHHEFFIRRVKSAKAAAPAPVAADGESKAAAPDPGAGLADGEGGAVEWNSQYKLELSMLPTSYLQLATANKILFIGKAVSLLQHPAVASFGGSQLPHNDVVAFSKALHHLREQAVFDPYSVAATLEDMRLVVTRHLWNLVVVKARLPEHLETLKAYFLVTKGEFYQSFLDAVDARQLFHLPPGPRAERDINDGPFQQAAQQCGVEEDEFFRRLSVKLEQGSFSFPRFASQDTTGYGNARPNSVVLLGGCEHVDGLLRLTGPASQHTSAAWYSSRKVVDRGFTSKCIFRAPNGSAPVGDSQALLAAASWSAAKGRAEVGRPRKWMAKGQGFSFVIQNTGLGVVPEVVSAPWDGVNFDDVHNSYVTDTGQRELLSYSAVPNSFEVYLHVAAPELPSRASGSSGGPEESFVSVLSRAPDSSETLCIAYAASSGDSYPAGSSLPSAAMALAALGDGREHSLLIEYEPPTEARDGRLRVFVDSLSQPVLQIETSLSKYLRFDGGRAWAGFTAASGFANRTAHRDAHVVGQLRDILGWEFKEAESASVKAWRNLRLEYKVEAPIDLVLLTDGFDRYNALFRFLFLVKHVQVRLQKAWPWQMRSRTLSQEAQNKLIPVFALRCNMQFLIDNLQYYLHVDVIEEEFAKLKTAIDEAMDFESVRRVHEEYLASLARLCFLHARYLSRALFNILDICLSFCHALEQEQYNISAATVAKLTQDFQLQACLLFTILSKKTGQYVAPKLSQLVTRIDYNRFWTEQAVKLDVERVLNSV